MMMQGPPPPNMGVPPPGMVMASQQMLPPPGTIMQGPPPPMMVSGPPPPMMMGGPPPQMMGGPPQGPPGGPPPAPMSQPPPQQRPLPVGGKHIPLARCRVLYLGSAVPLETAVGLEAVQQPLRERYSGDDGDVPGIDAWCTVFSSGIQMQYVDDKDNVTWFPIQTLHVCAAAKCVVQVNGANGERIPRFVALDSDAARGSPHPPMFASIMRRTKGVKVLECHAFICKSEAAAMAMVHASTHAYEHKEGWTDDAPPTDAFPHEAHLVPAEPNRPKDASKEFYDRPPQQGYYYAKSKHLVKHYNVLGGEGDGPPPRRGPMSDIGRPSSPPPMRGPPGPPGGRMGPPVVVPLAGIPSGIPPGAPAPPLPPGPILGTPAPYMLPPPPRGYFADWDRFGGRPIAIFGGPPGPRDEMYGIDPPNRDLDDRRPRRNRRHRSRERYRSHSPHYRSDSSSSYSSSDSEYDDRPRRRRRPSRDRRDSRDYRDRDRDRGREYYRGRDYDKDYDRAPRRRPRTPPADYPDRASDLQVFARQYNNAGDDYFYGGNTGRSALERDLSPSRHNPEILMKRDDRPRRTSPPARHASPRPNRARSPEPRIFPSQERNFGASIREERRAIGGYDRGPDAYDLNDYRRQYDDDDYGRGRGRMRDLEEKLGYYP